MTTAQRLTGDPTSRQDAASNAAYVARERALPDPRLTTVPVVQKCRSVPQDRCAMAGGNGAALEAFLSNEPTHDPGPEPRT